MLHWVYPLAPVFLYFFFPSSGRHRDLHSFPTRRSSDLFLFRTKLPTGEDEQLKERREFWNLIEQGERSEEHTSELQSRFDLVCRLLLEKKKEGMLLDSSPPCSVLIRYQSVRSVPVGLDR